MNDTVEDNQIVITLTQARHRRFSKGLIMLAVGLSALMLSLPSEAQCLRVMSNEELILSSAIIARVRVLSTEKAKYEGNYSQLATMQVLEVISGDTNVRNLHVWAETQTFCANDSYRQGQEMLVFLTRETTFYKTQNYQYGEFVIANDTVVGWRDKEKGPQNKPYADVAAEIHTVLSQRVFSEFNVVTNQNTVIKVP